MASTRLYLAILVVTGTLWEETSGLQRPIYKKPMAKRRLLFMKEAQMYFDDAKGNVRFNLAPTYGTLDAKSLQQLDESLKVMIGELLKLDFERGYTWKELKSLFDSNPFMIREPGRSMDRLERVAFKSTRYFGFGSNKGTRKKIIRLWFSNLIENVDILKDTDIDLDSISQMVSKISVEMLDNLLTKRTKRKVVMDRAILRFPDISHPFFTVYHIGLMAKCIYKTYMVRQKESSDIVGVYQKEVYYPNHDYIKSLKREMVDQILLEVDDLFSDV